MRIRVRARKDCPGCHKWFLMRQALEVDARERTIVEGMGGFPFEEGGLRSVASKVLLGRNEGVQFRRSTSGTLLKLVDGQVAVRFDLGVVVLLCFEVFQVGLQRSLLVSSLKLTLGDHALQADLLGLEFGQHRFGSLELFLKIKLCKLFSFHGIADLVFKVLHDHGDELDNAFGLVLAAALAGEGGLRSLVRGNLELRALLRQRCPLHRPKLNRVVCVVGRQDVPGRLQQHNGILVFLLGRQEGLIFGQAQRLHFHNLLLCVRYGNDGVCLLLLQLLNEDVELVDLCLVLFYQPFNFSNLALDLLILFQALITFLDIFGGFILQRLDHRVNGLDHLVEVAHLCKADFSSQPCEA
mmetsp:Transcript_86490/g.201265  ORF Transcript_86490/g.201265 Transcript_86490/m.201265 type:complete len:354 (-) Transcript_86490:1195-2256(-)